MRDVEDAIDPQRSLFLVSTKSGGTIETISLFKHFWAVVPDGQRFVAITDPGSGVEAMAKEHGFRRIFRNDPEIGGRYSALSFFGMVPAALMGADVRGDPRQRRRGRAGLRRARQLAGQQRPVAGRRRWASWPCAAATSSRSSSTRR